METINTLNTAPKSTPVIDFIFGNRILDLTVGTTFTSTTVTMGTSSVVSVLAGQRVTVIDGRNVSTATVVSRNTSTHVVTVDAWHNGRGLIPSSGARVLIDDLGAQYSYTIDGVTYAPSNARIFLTSNTLFFTAFVDFTQVAAEPMFYTWDFGDRVLGFGATTTHRYVVPSDNMRAVLRVTDSQGTDWTCGKQVYIDDPTPIRHGKITSDLLYLT